MRSRHVMMSAAALLAIAGSAAASDAPIRPNVVWIIADDMCPDAGCYGHPLVRTPNIDRLAAEGVRYTRTYATSPVCSPSRSAFNTGMYQTTIGAHQHRTADPVKPTLPDDVRLISQRFRDAGYYTANGSGRAGSKPGKTDFNFRTEDRWFDGGDWSGRAEGQPFFAQVQIHEPHRTFKATPDRPIPMDAVRVPPQYPDHPLLRWDWSMYLQTVQIVDDRVGAVLERLDEEGLAENTIVFFFADHGRAHLRAKQWLYEGGIHVPLIIRWPGQAQPEAVSNHLVSLIDVGPMSLALCGIEDGFDTQGRPFALPGAEVLGPSGGEFAPARRRYVFAARDRCDETSDRIRAVRTDQHKYIRNFHPQRPYTSFNIYKESQYPALAVMRTMYARGELTGDAAAFMADHRPAEELYDLTADPHELHNLADDPDYAAVLRELRAALNDWIERTNDQGATSESQSEIDRWQAWSAKRTPQRYKGKFNLPADCTAADRLRAWYRIAGLPVPPEQPRE